MLEVSSQRGLKCTQSKKCIEHLLYMMHADAGDSEARAVMLVEGILAPVTNKPPNFIKFGDFIKCFSSHNSPTQRFPSTGGGVHPFPQGHSAGNSAISHRGFHGHPGL